jgi:phage terminase small subunit
VASIAMLSAVVSGRRTGEPVQNPAMQLWRDASMLMMSAGARFGLSPADRASLTVPVADSDASDALFSR